MATAALFDLDGVIIDTEPQYTTFWQGIGHRYFPHDPQFAQGVKGQTLVTILDKYFPSPADADNIRAALNDFEATMAYPLVPGALAFVDALRLAGIPTAVVTSSDHAKMSSLYHQHPSLSAHFTAVLTAEDTPRSKPAPDCYLIAARRLGADIARSAVFEDSFNGLTAARASGARVVALATSNPADAVRPYADTVIPHFLQFTVDDLRRLVSHEN